MDSYHLAMEAAVRAVRKLHAPVDGWCDHCTAESFPCPTIQAVDAATGKAPAARPTDERAVEMRRMAHDAFDALASPPDPEDDPEDVWVAGFYEGFKTADAASGPKEDDRG